MLADPRTRRLYEDEILKYSRDFRTFELVRNFWLVAEPFTRGRRHADADDENAAP